MTAKFLILDFTLADPRVTTNSTQFKKDVVAQGGGIDKGLLKKTIADMRNSHFDIGKFAFYSLIVTCQNELGTNWNGLHCFVI